MSTPHERANEPDSASRAANEPSWDTPTTPPQKPTRSSDGSTVDSPGGPTSFDQLQIADDLLSKSWLDSLADVAHKTGESGRAVVEEIVGYQLLGELGRGGMGVVYKARQRHPARIVALKMILGSGHGGEAALQRFHQEANAIGKLQHPNIVQIFNVGESDGHPFFAMEFCSGGSLEGKIRLQLPHPNEAARTLATIARAVHAAHEAQIVHRDLKPANILLAPQPKDTKSNKSGVLATLRNLAPLNEHSLELWIPKITDFGLAKHLDSDAGHTHTGTVMGTPSYMAPEQASGNTKKVGPAADIWSLGAILYEMLTGRPPFKGSTPMDTLLMVLEEEPIAPSVIQPKIPRDLETICLKCLRKEPKQRYASAADLADDLERFLNHEPISARPVRGLERAYKWAKRRPTAAALLLLLGIVPTLLLVLATLYGQRVTDERNKARIALDEAEAASLREREQRAAADAARQDALAAKARSEERLLRFFGDTGLELAYGTDPLSALPWLIEGLRIATPTRPEQADDFRRRLAHLLRDAPQLERLWIHPAPIRALALAPNRRQFAVGGDDGSVTLQSLDDGKQLGATLRHPDAVRTIRYSKNGLRLITTAADKSARVWDALSGAPLTPPLAHPQSISLGVLNADGTLAATACNDGFARIWETTTGKIKHTLAHKGPVTHIEFRPDGKALLTTSEDRLARLWDPTTGVLRRELRGHDREIRCAAISHDGKWLATGDQIGTILLWSADDKTPGFVRAEAGHEALLRLAFSADDTKLVAHGLENTAFVFHLKVIEQATEHHELTRPGERDAPVAEMPPGQGEKAPPRAVTIVRRKQLSPVGMVGIPGDQPLSWAAFRADAALLATGGVDQTARVWFLPEVEVQQPLDPIKAVSLDQVAWVQAPPPRLPLGTEKHAALRHGGEVSAVEFPDEAHLLTASEDRTIRLWRLPVSDPRPLFLSSQRDINRVEFCAGGRFVLTCGDDGKTRIWNAATGMSLAEPIAHSERVTALAVHPNGQSGASGDRNGIVTMWETSTGKVDRMPIQHASGITELAYSPDGVFLLTACRDHSAHLFEVATGKLVRTFCHGPPPRFAPRPVRITPLPLPKEQFPPKASEEMRWLDGTTAGQFVIRQDEKKELKLPTLPSLDLSFAAPEAVSGLLHVEFHPAGTMLVTVGSDRIVKLWSLKSPEMPPRELPKSVGSVTYATFSADGSLLLTTGRGGAQFWDTATLKPIGAPLRHLGPILTAEFSPTNELVVTGGTDGNARVWEVRSGTLRATISNPAHRFGPILRTKFSPDGRTVLLVAKGGAVTADPMTGSILEMFLEPFGDLTWGTFDPSGERAAISSRAGTARIYLLPKPETRSFAELDRLGRILSGRFFGTDGELQTVTPEQLADALLRSANDK